LRPAQRRPGPKQPRWNQASRGKCSVERHSQLQFHNPTGKLCPVEHPSQPKEIDNYGKPNLICPNLC
jgi:hypothetical protein